MGRLAVGQILAQLRGKTSVNHSYVDFHLILPSDMPLHQAHDICDRIEDDLMETLPGLGVTIHIEPEYLAHSGTHPRVTDIRMH